MTILRCGFCDRWQAEIPDDMSKERLFSVQSQARAHNNYCENPKATQSNIIGVYINEGKLDA